MLCSNNPGYSRRQDIVKAVAFPDLNGSPLKVYLAV